MEKNIGRKKEEKKMICKKRWCKEFVGHRSTRGFCYKHRLQPPLINESLYNQCKCKRLKLKRRSLCTRCEHKFTRKITITYPY